ncbi:hypothetical protein LAZ67_X003271 [Cordylochernes scorpioides]|uniref:CCHC-type domain-containing protein n=1 Tax=Cordylochernes scorpioides TaxID=51811 RepID=A0ABY6LW64_9ARAC|nr:hypothetical protein LAZ67_X003271 [Cordylochernes scorpioides]
MSRDERILQRKLSCQIRRIDGFIESVDSIIQAGETIRLEIMGEELKEIKEKIETLYDELFSLDEVDIDKESEAYDGSMNKIGSLRVKIENERKLKEKLADIKPNGSQANIKLPQFDLPIYDGDMGKWINFKELFLTTIDAHPGLTNIQKLQYLNSAVKGEAARLIRGFPLLSENYGQAWSTLLSRYDNPRELAYAQVSKIFSLRAIKNPSAKCLHEFMDVCNEAIRNLETLELKRNQLVDVILVHFLQQKLSENLRLDWELSMDNTLPSYDKFIAFISRHARSMSCAVKECSKREETTGSRFPKCQSYGMLIEKSDTCILCKSGHHPLYMCNLFCKMPLKEKLNVVKGHKLCFNCLRKGHFSWNCRLNQRCKVCKGKHHTMIHYDKPSTEGASAQVENTTPKEHESAINLTNTQQANCNDSHVLLATARIKIKNGLGKLCTCRALLDSGSQVTMITKGCCERLGLVQRKSDRMIIGVGNTPVQHSSSTVSVTFCPLNNSEEFSVEAVVTGVLTSEIPNFRLKDPNWPTLKNLKLADPEFYIQAPIDMILGADIYTELMLNGSISLGEGLPMAINTRLGWVLLGKLMGTSESNTEVCNLSLQSEPELEFVMKRFWEIESVPSPDLCTQDEYCESLFSNNHGRDSHGRYWVKLPFRQHRPLLGESREKALRRFLSLEGKLCKNVKLYDQYRGFMKEYEHLNHMERVPIAEVKRELCRCYYMPHHPEDADYQRILWKPSPEEPVVDYRLLTVTYGTTLSPFLAMRTLQQLAEDEGQNYPEASRVTLNDFYVDDLLTGAQTIAETKELIDQLKDLMKKGGFHLRKWNSNCQEIVSHVEEMNEEKKINLEKGAISKILGIVWDHVQDTFRVNITLPEEVVTKGDLLSNIARIFDPIGFLSPTTVAMANLQRQTAVKQVEDLEGLPVYHRAILKENGKWPEVTKAIQCSYPKVFVGDGTHLYLLIEDVESLDGPNVRSVLCQYHIPHKKWIWRKVNGFAPIVISKSIVYASHDKRVYFVGGRIHSRGNKVTCTDNIVRVKLKEGRASVLVKSRKSPLTDLLVLAMTFAPSAFLFMLAETRDHSTYKVFSYHLLNKDWHLSGSDKIFWKEKFLSLQICYTNKKLLLFPRMQWEQHFCNLYNYRLQTDSWGCYTAIPILGEKEGYPKNINHFTIVQDWVRAVFVHAGKESKYLWKLNLKSKQWTELPTYVKYRDSQYTAVALDLVFILRPADKEHETAEKYLSFFKTRRCELPKFGLLPESTYDLLRSWLRFPSNLNQGSAAGGRLQPELSTVLAFPARKKMEREENRPFCHRWSDPTVFSGERGEDSQRWLSDFQRVARYNNEVLVRKPRVILNSWEEFKIKFCEIFGNKEDTARKAENILRTRAQTSGENVESYIQEVLLLCKQSNPGMSEGEKVSHLIKVVAEEVYQALVGKDISTVDQFVAFCRRFEAFKRMRVAPPRISTLHLPTYGISSVVKSSRHWLLSLPLVSPRASTLGDNSSPRTIKVTDEELKDHQISKGLSGVLKMTNQFASTADDPDMSSVIVENDSRSSLKPGQEMLDFRVDPRDMTPTTTMYRPKPRRASTGALPHIQAVQGRQPEDNPSRQPVVSAVLPILRIHDIIFGFKATEAIIDCGRNELHLGETSVLESREEENQILFASDDFVIPPKSIKKISVINEEICGVRDVLVSTSKDLLLRKEVLIPNSLVTFRHGRGSIWVANGASWPQLIPSGMNMFTMESFENGNICSLIEYSDKLQETQLKSREWSQKINLTLDPGLSGIQRLQLVSCHDEFIDTFEFGRTPIKPTSTVKHKINTGDHSPIKQRPYRVAPSERRLIQDEVNEMIENHIVKPSESPWSSPVILVCRERWDLEILRRLSSIK